MKCYTVAIRDMSGEFSTAYLGNDLTEAKRIYREYRTDLPKKNCMAVFFFPKPSSKRVNGLGRQFEHDAKVEFMEARNAPPAAPKKKKEKPSDDN